MAIHCPARRRARGRARRRAGGRPAITERELAIVRLIAHGLVNKEIASALHLQPSTVASRLRLLYARLGVERRAALVHTLVDLL